MVAGLLLACGVGLSSAQARFFCGPVGFSSFQAASGRFGFGFGFGGGFAFQRFQQTTFFAPPLFYGPPPYLGWSGAGNPWFFPPPVVVQPVFTPPIVIVQAQAPTEPFAQGFRAGYGSPVRPAVYEVDVTRRPEPPSVGVRRGNFVVVRPGAGRTVPAVAETPAPKPPLLEPRFGRFSGEPFASAPLKPSDPRTESIQRVNRARVAFAAEQYGRAGEQLRAAITATPTQPLPYFLLAEVQCARNEYAEAVQTIRAGLKQAPDWPAWPFQLQAIYGEHPERFQKHLAELEQTLARHPQEPALLFLLGYHRWFLGDREAAVRLFDQIIDRANPDDLVTPFLRESGKRQAQLPPDTTADGDRRVRLTMERFSPR
jgi:hypothetical protein